MSKALESAAREGPSKSRRDRGFNNGSLTMITGQQRDADQAFDANRRERHLRRVCFFISTQILVVCACTGLRRTGASRAAADGRLLSAQAGHQHYGALAAARPRAHYAPLETVCGAAARDSSRGGAGACQGAV